MIPRLQRPGSASIAPPLYSLLPKRLLLPHRHVYVCYRALMCGCSPHAQAILSRREADSSQRGASVLPAGSPLGAGLLILFRLLSGDLQCSLNQSSARVRTMSEALQIELSKSSLVMTRKELQEALNGAANELAQAARGGTASANGRRSGQRV